MAGVKGQRSGGHNRKSTEELKASGGYRKDRHGGRAEVHIEADTPAMPDHLTAAGKKLWKRIVETLPPKVITSLDAESLAIYCDLSELYVRLRKKFMDDPTDKDVRSSYFGVFDRLNKIGGQFGWSPLSRSGLQMPAEQKDEDDPMEELIARMGGKG